MSKSGICIGWLKLPVGAVLSPVPTTGKITNVGGV